MQVQMYLLARFQIFFTKNIEIIQIFFKKNIVIFQIFSKKNIARFKIFLKKNIVIFQIFFKKNIVTFQIFGLLTALATQRVLILTDHPMYGTNATVKDVLAPLSTYCTQYNGKCSITIRVTDQSKEILSKSSLISFLNNFFNQIK